MRRSLALLGLPLLVLAGCATPGSGPAAPTGATPDQRWAAFDQRAAEVADAWRPGQAWRSGYVPLEDATVLTGDPGFTGETKLVFTNGWFRHQIPMPTATPPDGTIRFPDGTLRVPLVSAAEAYAQLDKGDPPPCEGRPMAPPPAPGGGVAKPGGPTIQPGPDGPVSTAVDTPCVPLTVTGVTLGSAPVRTSRGQAEVPAWLFTVEGMRVPVARLAVAAGAIGAVPEGVGTDRPLTDGVVSVQSLDGVDGTRLDYRVGVGACDTGVTPLVLERDDVVVLGAGVTRSTGPCTLQLVLKPVSVTLKAPLGDRAVLDVAGVTPLTVVRR
ncbi:hypothetical protein Q2K19_05880 [Micromonospora soli]|uniref:hypothetical protein n=1 Tax=Micromonospora sp. NBRC 110009 TaxID=3061627 RepID=UPI0026720220|nr:hypothetical protein [Micromonospora sp. NBRC 110009]WKU00018.1 hypothetical protein Q2K19_05880 [Micromonospora sp. NBRC 110009]